MKLIRTTGETKDLIFNGDHATLQDLQRAVGGYIETLTTEDGKRLVVNEEGKLKGLPINVIATGLVSRRYRDIILGDAVLCEPNELM